MQLEKEDTPLSNLKSNYLCTKNYVQILLFAVHVIVFNKRTCSYLNDLIL